MHHPEAPFTATPSPFPKRKTRTMRAISTLFRRSAPLRRHHTSTAHDNYYKLLGVTESFTVDTDQLAERFKHLQRQWHPDKFVARPQPDRQGAADMSARINEAYSVLRAPYKRAKHLLHIRAEHSLPQLPHIDHLQLDPDFLLWVMHIREQIADAAGDETKLAHVKQSVEQALDDCLTSLTKAFEGDLLEDAATETAKLQYLRRMEQAIQDFS